LITEAGRGLSTLGYVYMRTLTKPQSPSLTLVPRVDFRRGRPAELNPEKFSHEASHKLGDAGDFHHHKRVGPSVLRSDSAEESVHYHGLPPTGRKQVGQ